MKRTYVRVTTSTWHTACNGAGGGARSRTRNIPVGELGIGRAGLDARTLVGVWSFPYSSHRPPALVEYSTAVHHGARFPAHISLQARALAMLWSEAGEKIFRGVRSALAVASKGCEITSEQVPTWNYHAQPSLAGLALCTGTLVCNRSEGQSGRAAMLTGQVVALAAAPPGGRIDEVEGQRAILGPVAPYSGQSIARANAKSTGGEWGGKLRC